MNKIHTLRIEQESIQGPIIKEHIYHHFKRLFGGKKSRLQMKEGTWTTIVNLGNLEEEFQDEEFKKAIWELGPDKALDSDGFPLFFFRIF